LVVVRSIWIVVFLVLPHRAGADCWSPKASPIESLVVGRWAEQDCADAEDPMTRGMKGKVLRATYDMPLPVRHGNVTGRRSLSAPETKNP
jgi:hypothetical protein